MKPFLKWLWCISMFLLPTLNLSSQPKLGSNDTILFSFKTKSNLKIQLSASLNDSSIHFSMYDSSVIKIYQAFKKNEQAIHYSYYFRGGGAQNEGLDLNYVYFKIKNELLVLYDTYAATDDKIEIGLKIINPNNKVVQEYISLKETCVGRLIDFRYSNWLSVGDKLFD